jgi:hypothetical protein
MEHSSSSEANSGSGIQEILRLLWNPKFHYPLHMSSPFDSTTNHMNPVHNFTHYFFKLYFNIILPSTSRSSKWSLPLRLSY